MSNILNIFSKSSSKKPRAGMEESGKEKPDIRLTSVFDNHVVKEELKMGWGFSTIIETGTENILFDTGADAEILLSNIYKMDIDPVSIDKVFLSHNHFDHLGGLEGFLKKNNNVTVYTPESFPDDLKDTILKKGAKKVEVKGFDKISDFIYTTGDLLGPPAEQSLMIDSKKGLIVITSCAHPGVEKIVKKAKELMEKDKVHMVVGGFHKPDESIIKEFKAIPVEKVAPSHCTGDEIKDLFAREYQDDYIEYGAGKILEIK